MSAGQTPNVATPPKAASKSEQKRRDAQAKNGNGGGDAPTKEKKARAPRQDYGFAKDAVIRLTDGEKSYRGKRLEMYEKLKASNGKTVEHFLESNKNDDDPPRGWLRFFVQTEACRLEGGTKPAPKEQKAEASTAASS